MDIKALAELPTIYAFTYAYAAFLLVGAAASVPREVPFR
jgi:hypothetical protein